jgi:hypothetical protein
MHNILIFTNSAPGDAVSGDAVTVLDLSLRECRAHLAGSK